MSDFWVELDDDNHVWALADDDEIAEYMDLLTEANLEGVIEVPEAMYQRLVMYFTSVKDFSMDNNILKWKDTYVVCEDSRD